VRPPPISSDNLSDQILCDCPSIYLHPKIGKFSIASIRAQFSLFCFILLRVSLLISKFQQLPSLKTNSIITSVQIWSSTLAIFLSKSHSRSTNHQMERGKKCLENNRMCHLTFRSIKLIFNDSIILTLCVHYKNHEIKKSRVLY